MLGARSRELANGSLKALGGAWGDGFTIAMTGASSRELADGSLRALGEAWGASSTIAIAWSEFLMPRLALPSLSGSGWQWLPRLALHGLVGLPEHLCHGLVWVNFGLSVSPVQAHKFAGGSWKKHTFWVPQVGTRFKG